MRQRGRAVKVMMGAALAIGAMVVSPLHASAAIIDNGSLVQLGINDEGHFNVPGGTPSMPSSSTTDVGLRYIPTNGEATAPGCLCEGWGVGNADAATGTFSGYANISSDGGAFNLTVQAGTGVYGADVSILAESVGSQFKSIVTVDDAGVDRLRVTHDYHPATSIAGGPVSALYQVDVTIENIGATDVGDLRYRRVMDWDIAPDTFNEWVELHPGAAGPGNAVIHLTSDGFTSANPLSDPTPFVGVPPTTVLPGDPDYFSGPYDQGALFDFGFGSLAAGATKTFTAFYGAAGTRADALTALGLVGAGVYSLGIPTLTDGTGGADIDGPHVFIFAFGKGVCDPAICKPPSEVPEPATLLLLGSGLVGVAASRKWFGR